MYRPCRTANGHVVPWEACVDHAQRSTAAHVQAEAEALLRSTAQRHQHPQAHPSPNQIVLPAFAPRRRRQPSLPSYHSPPATGTVPAPMPALPLSQLAAQQPQQLAPSSSPPLSSQPRMRIRLRPCNARDYGGSLPCPSGPIFRL